MAKANILAQTQLRKNAADDKPIEKVPESVQKIVEDVTMGLAPAGCRMTP